MDCGGLYLRHQSEAEYVACAVTYPFIYCFPYVAILFCILLVACRMAHIRAFYVLFKHGVLIDFENPPRLGRKVSLMMCGLLLGSVLHFLMIMSYGGPWMWHSGCQHSGLGRFACMAAGQWKDVMFINTDYDYKTNTWWELMMNPYLLTTKENKNLIQMLSIVFMQYLLPSIVAIAFAESCDNFENDVVPVAKLMEANPRGMAAYLSEVRFMPEPTVRDFILSSSFASTCREQPCHIKDLCENLKQTCATVEAQDVENALQHQNTITGNHELSLLDFAALDGQEWWPVKMLLNTETDDRESLKFKIAWGIYFIITLVIAASLVGESTLSVMRKAHWIIYAQHRKPQLWNLPQEIVKTVIGLYYCLAMYTMLSFSSIICSAWAELRKLDSSSSADDPTPSATITAATPSLMP